LFCKTIKKSKETSEKIPFSENSYNAIYKYKFIVT